MKNSLKLIPAISVLLFFVACRSQRSCEQSDMAQALKHGILISNAIDSPYKAEEISNREVIIEKLCKRIKKTQKLILFEQDGIGSPRSVFVYNYDRQEGYSFSMRFDVGARSPKLVKDTLGKFAFSRLFSKIKDDPVREFERLKPVYAAQYVFDASPIYMHYVDLTKGINYYDVLKFATNM